LRVCAGNKSTPVVIGITCMWSLAIPSFFEIKESDGVGDLSEKNRICFFKPALIANLNAAREPETVPSRSRESMGERWR